MPKYREAVERLRKTQEARAELETKIDNSDDLREKILLERQLIGAYQREQEALQNLNDQRESTISSNVKALRDLGFEVQYNADRSILISCQSQKRQRKSISCKRATIWMQRCFLYKYTNPQYVRRKDEML